MISVGGLVVALDGAEFEGDARGKHEPVVGELATALRATVFATGSMVTAVSWMTLMPYRCASLS